MKTYEVQQSCEVAGTWRNKGETIEMTDRQAEHLAPPHGSVILPVQTKPVEDADLDRK